MGGSDCGLACEIVTDPLGELAGHPVGTYGHGGAFGTQGWIDPENELISIMRIQRQEGSKHAVRAAIRAMAESSVGQ
jgi:CubicO group peptidase (beta-lactamase class C family)